MSLRRWLLAPFARLFRYVHELGEFFFSSPAFNRARPKKLEPTRLEGPVPLEFRGSPDDWMGLITGGLGLGQLGWLVPQPALPPGLQQQSSAPPWADDNAPRPGGEALAPAASAAATSAEQGSASAPAPTSESGTTAQKGQDDGPYSLKDWANSVGTLLDAMDASATQSPTNGGGGSGFYEPPAPLVGDGDAGFGGAGAAGGAAQLAAPDAQGASAGANGAAAVGGAGLLAASQGGASQGASAQAGAGAALVQEGAAQERVAEGKAGASAQALGHGQLPLAYELNVGQVDGRVNFLSRGPGFGFWLTRDNQMVFSLARPQGDQGDQAEGRDVFRLGLVGATQDAPTFGRGLLASRSNYFVGDTQFSNVANYASVEKVGVWSGVDLVLRSVAPDDRRFEFDFRVRPGGNLEQVVLSASGVDGTRLDEQGRLLISVGGRDVVMEAPVMYQEGANGAREMVQGRYVLRQGGIGFEVTGPYDASRALVVDPALSFASYLGGSGSDKAYSVAVDDAGASFITGETASSDFPSSDGFGPGGGTDVFVSKISPDGKTLLYSTIYGGSGTDTGQSIAVAPSGDAFVVGNTTSSDLATTTGPGSIGGAFRGFAMKLSPAGDALEYSRYMPAASSHAWGATYWVGTGDLYVVSDVTAGPLVQGRLDVIGPDGTAGGSSLQGASGTTSLRGVALASGGPNSGVFVAGYTTSTGFGTPLGLPGTKDGLVLKFNGTTLFGSKRVGGAGEDEMHAVAAAQGGFVFAVGYSGSPGTKDAGVYALDTSVGSVVASATLGGSGDQTAEAVLVTDAQVWVAGTTTAAISTTAGAIQPSYGGGASDAFLAALPITLSTTVYASHYGGSGADEGRGLAKDARNDLYLTGFTGSSDLPGVTQTYQTSNAGGNDAYLAKFLTRKTQTPALVSISSDSGASATDLLTNDQTLVLYGTAAASATVSVYRDGAGLLGTTAANSLGYWSFDYTGVSLPEGSQAIYLRANDGSFDSDFSRDFLVHTDLTGPTVYLDAPSSTNTLAPVVRVAAIDRFGLAANPTVTLDVDKNNDGDFIDAGETGYASSTLTNGQTTITLPALSGTGTIRVRARVLDLAGNEGTSAASTIVVSAQGSPWVATAQTLTVSPLNSDLWLPALGDVSTAHGLDLDTSPGTQQGGSPALAYHSSSVSQKPVIQVALPSDTGASMPATVTARLTFDGVAAATVTYNTSSFAPGDVLTLALQANQTITTTGRYGYSVLVQVPGQADQNVTGSMFVVAQDSSPFGAGWSMAGVDRLVSISASGGDPAGMLRVLGSGGYQFYTGTSTYASEAGDNGTLTVSGGTYTYSTPDGQAWTFNSSGYQRKWTSADGLTSILYSYDMSNRLSGLTAVDGTLNTITYTGSTDVAFLSSNGRTTSLALSSGDLTKITNPDGGLRTFTYASHRLTQDQYGPNLENNYAFGSYGGVTTITQGASTYGGESNPTTIAVSPALLQGIGTTPVAGTVFGSTTDAVGARTAYSVDTRGRAQLIVAADGGATRYGYSGGYAETVTDALGRVTSYTRDGSGYVTKVTWADATSMTYAYQNAFHALTTMVNELGATATYAYDGSGHLTSATDALGNRATFGYNNGLLETAKDARGFATTHLYDSSRRETVTTDALGNSTTVGYDSNGNPQTVTNARGFTTTFGNDALGRATTVADPLGKVSTYTYDGAGLNTGGVDPSGLRGSVVYDGFKRGMPSQTVSGVGGALQQTGLSDFDDAGRPLVDRGGAGYSTFSSYLPTGELQSTTDAKGGSAYAFHDLVGRVLGRRDEMGRWALFGYDQRGRVTGTTDNLGNVTTSAFDAAGNLTAQTDALGQTVTYSYDALNRQTGTLDALGRRTTAAYDRVGNVTLASDRRGVQTSASYDALNRVVATTEAYGTGVARGTETRFDQAGNVTGTRDTRGNWTTYSYNQRDERTETIDALGGRATYAYADAGELKTARDALGKAVTFLYDALHRGAGYSDQVGQTTTMVANAWNEPAAEVDPLLNAQNTLFDELGRGGGQQDALGGLSQTQYDASGNVRMETGPTGGEWRYEYDGLGRQSASIDPLGARATTSYDALGRVTEAVNALGGQALSSYDAGGRLTREVFKSASGVTLSVMTFAYDNEDNLTGEQGPAGTTTYAYDELGRQTQRTDALGGLWTTLYDAADNVTATTDALGRTGTQAYDALNRMTSSTDVLGGRATVLYEARGQVTAQADARGFTTSFAYDDAGRLTKTTDALGGVATILYDEAGRRTGSIDQLGRRATVAYDQAGNATASTDPLGRTTSYGYDLAGRMTTSTDPLGHTTTTAYDKAGRQTQVTDALGGLWSTAYDAAGNATLSIDALGRRTTTVFDEMSRATKSTDALGGVATVLYDLAGRATTTIDQLGRRTTQGFDALDRATQTTDALGGLWTQAYDAVGNQTLSIDALGRRTTTAFDAGDRATRVTGPTGAVTSYAFDLAGNLTAQVDARGFTTSFAFDQLGRQTQKTDALGGLWTALYDAAGQQTGSVDALGRRATQAYDAAGQVTASTDALNQTGTFAYDAAGNQTLSVDALGRRTTVGFDALNRATRTTDALGGLWTRAYDAVGNQTLSIDALGRRTTVGFDALDRPTQTTDALGGLMTTGYDAVGNQTLSIDQLGRRTTQSLDALNRATQTTDALGGLWTQAYDAVGNQTLSIDAIGRRTTAGYDAADRVTTSTDPTGATTTSAFDLANNLTAQTDARGFTTSFAYDQLGRQTRTTNALGGLWTSLYDAVGQQTGSIDALGHRATVAYDARGQVTASTDALGRTGTFGYDAVGNKTASIDPAGFRTTTSYDALNRVVDTKAPDGGLSTALYDAVGNRTVSIDPLGQRTTAAFDALNRQTLSTGPRGYGTSYSFDAVGNRTLLVDPSGNCTTMGYDALGRMTQSTDPLGVSGTIAYDAAGQKTSTTDGLGRRRDSSYDGAGRLTAEAWVETGSTVGRLTITYDQVGNRLTDASGVGTNTYAYDQLGRVTAQSDVWGLSSTLSYDAVGNLTRVADGLGGVATYAYDQANALASVLFSAGTVTLRQDRQYDARGMLATVTRYSDLSGTTKVGDSLYQYDDVGREKNTRHRDGSGTTLAESTYTYDLAGRVTAEKFNGANTSVGYDASDEVTSFGAESYGFDASGNRNSAGYSVGAGNRVSTDGVWTYTYDSEGQRTKKSKGAGAETWTFGYDTRGQMLWAEKRATDAGTLQWRQEFAYDAQGDRVRTTTFDGTTTVTYRTAFGPDGEAWADVDAGNALIDQYVRAPGEELPVARRNALGASAWLHGDRLSSLRLVTDGTGTQKDLISYTAFGKVASESDASWGGRFKWTGQEAESVLGQQRHGWRWYDLETGSWTTRDPIGFSAGDYNLTRYVGNNAANATDPSGLELWATRRQADRITAWARSWGLQYDTAIDPDGDVLIDFSMNSKDKWLDVRNRVQQKFKQGWVMDVYWEGTTSTTQHWCVLENGSFKRFANDFAREDLRNFVWWFRNDRKRGVLFNNEAVKLKRYFTPSSNFDEEKFWRAADQQSPGIRLWYQQHQTGSLVRRNYSVAYLARDNYGMDYIDHGSATVFYLADGYSEEAGAKLFVKTFQTKFSEDLVQEKYGDVVKYHHDAHAAYVARQERLHQELMYTKAKAVQAVKLWYGSLLGAQVAAAGGPGLAAPETAVEVGGMAFGALGEMWLARIMSGGGADRLDYLEAGMSGASHGRQDPASAFLRLVAMPSAYYGRKALGGEDQRQVEQSARDWTRGTGLGANLAGAGVAGATAPDCNGQMQGVYGALWSAGPPAVGALAGYVGGHLSDAEDKLAWAEQGEAWGHLLSSIKRLWRPCFAAGTPILTPQGSKPIEQFSPGDLVLSRDENNLNGPVAPRVVEEVFVRSGRVLHLRVGGQVIRTTSEHPFWVGGEGWVEAGLLMPGDLLCSHDGRWLAVEEMSDTGDIALLYNMRVAEWHTYFVGCRQWGWSVWSHNADCLPINRPETHGSLGTPGVAHDPTMRQIATNYQAGTTRHPQMPAGVNPVRRQVRTNQAPLNPANPDGPPLRAGAVSPSGRYNVRPDVQVLGSDGRVYVTEVTRGGPVATANYQARRIAQLRAEYGNIQPGELGYVPGQVTPRLGGYNQVVLP